MTTNTNAPSSPITDSAVLCLDADLNDPHHINSVMQLLAEFIRDVISADSELPAYTRENLVPLLRQHPAARTYLAQLNGDYVGLAICQITLSSFQARPAMNIHDLHVSPAVRGRGIGTALIEYVADQARKEGCCQLTLEVEQANTRAKSLYHRTGFTSGRTLHEFWHRPL